jgi:hypothetical protein
MNHKDMIFHTRTELQNILMSFVRTQKRFAKPNILIVKEKAETERTSLIIKLKFSLRLISTTA